MKRLLLLAIACAVLPLQGQPVKRTILAIYYGSADAAGSRYALAHKVLTMPLNHQGLKVRYHDIRQPLPDLAAMDDLRGVLVATEGGLAPDAAVWLNWLDEVIRRKLKLFIMGDLAVDDEKDWRQATHLREVYKYLGLNFTGKWHRYTYNLEVMHKDDEVVDFERELSGVLSPFHIIKPHDSQVEPLLIMRANKDRAFDSVLVSVHPNGGYVADGYLYYTDPADNRQLYLNPFELFRRAYQTDEFPKPETSTLVGRRLFYSHIDGDGWNNATEIGDYDKGTLSAEVVMKELIEPYADLPVTIAPIAADLDPEWFGRKASRAIARKLFELPHVEAGSHTYSHPLNWYFFADGDPAKELPFLPLYPKARWKDLENTMTQAEAAAKRREIGRSPAMEGYKTPRAFGVKPFDLDLEIRGSVDYIAQFLPPQKKVRIVQWSGDTTVFPEALKMTRKLGLRNINGGDTRFDRQFPSYSWVAPLGWEVGDGRQIYASNSNENTYTDLWTGRFFGFQHLVKTIRNTEVPIRVKPLNVYYHMYSGEKIASRNAVKRNLDYARTRKIVPVLTSHFAAVADGFYSSQVVKTGENVWRISNRDGLQTLRMDRAIRKAVDFKRSQGVIGQSHYQGSLYIALDPDVPEAQLALRPHTRPDRRPQADRAYLIESRWPIRSLKVNSQGVTFMAEGFGKGEMTWYFAKRGVVRVAVKDDRKVLHRQVVQTNDAGLLSLVLPPVNGTTVTVELSNGQ